MKVTMMMSVIDLVLKRVPCRIFIARETPTHAWHQSIKRARLSLEDKAAGCLGLMPVLFCFPKVPMDSTNYTEPVSPGCAGAHRFISWLTEQFKCAVESVCSEKNFFQNTIFAVYPRA